MANVAIHAEGISKRYRIGEYHSGYETLRDAIARATRLAMRLEGRERFEEIWALDDVSFDVKEGEVVGFIGRNGAGKSTLLKILTRITPPTRGRAEIHGRVGAVLEVGTGFHPELTGRENIYLNGAILGMTRREINRKLSEIIGFSGVEKFMDTPVKRYSSGMYVRLAFAVAAHLDPEVLIIDEVLAVGDYEFQQRCMGRIKDVAGSGRTVLFVSHDLQSVSRLCERVYWLDGGKVMRSGPAHEVIADYLQAQMGIGAERSWDDSESAPGGGFVRLKSARIVNEDGRTIDTVDSRQPLGVQIEFAVLNRHKPVVPKIKLTNERAEIVFNALDPDPRWREPAEPGTYRVTAWIPGDLLNEGVMTVDVEVVTVAGRNLITRAKAPSALSFHVQDPATGDSAKGLFTGQLRGAIRPRLEWNRVREDALTGSSARVAS